MTISIPPLEGELVRTADEWSAIIKADLTSAVEGIVAAGQHLIAAKAEVRHGEWLPMLEQIGISRAHAFKLMKVSEKLNVSSSKHLPRSIEALYELSKLDPEEIEKGITDGDIGPDTTIKGAKDFGRKDKPKDPPKDEPRQEPEDWTADEDLPELEVDVDGRKFHEWSRRLREVKHDAHILLSEYTDSHVIMAHLLQMEIAGEWFTTTQKEYQNGTEE